MCFTAHYKSRVTIQNISNLGRQASHTHAAWDIEKVSAMPKFVVNIPIFNEEKGSFKIVHNNRSLRHNSCTILTCAIQSLAIWNVRLTNNKLFNDRYV